ncbi:MAG: hypothetical protein ABS884_11975, partial [Solibacillus isronensis]
VNRNLQRLAFGFRPFIITAQVTPYIHQHGQPVFSLEQHMMDRANELGVVKYFTKPFNIFEVRDEVNKLVEKTEKI